MTTMMTTDASRRLAGLCDDYLAAWLEASPFAASMLGLPGHDHAVPDVTPVATAGFSATMRQFASAARGLDTAELTATERTTVRVLVAFAEDDADVADLREVEFGTAPFHVAPHAQLLAVLPKVSLADAARADAYLTRLHAVPGWIDSCADQLRTGTATGRTAAARSLTRSIEALTEYLAGPLESDVLLSVPAPEWDGRPAWLAECRAAVRDEIRPSLQRLLDCYVVDLLPHARPDDKVGLGWLPDGPDSYATLVRSHTGTTKTPRELHELGLGVLADLEGEYAEIGTRIWGPVTHVEVLDRLRNDPELRLSSEAELLNLSQAAMDSAAAATPLWFGLLPPGPCDLRVVPELEAATAAPAFYQPPDLSTGRPGIYWVNSHDVTQRARWDVQAIAFHEAVPGHHLQIAIAQQLSTLPLFRRAKFTTAYAEGWGLYTERLAEEMGLYGSDTDRLGMLGLDSWRACRLVVDTGLHALGWTPQQAVDFMVANTALPLSVIVPEVDRYIGLPGQALAYMVGRLEITRMRAEAQQTLGDAFDIRGFHDVVLRGGSLPMTVLDDEVHDWVKAGGQP